MKTIKENKQIISERINELFNTWDQEDEQLSQELWRIEKDTIGIETKSLIGKFSINKNGNEDSLEIAKQMIKKLQEDKREHKSKMKEIKEKRKELKSKRQAEEEKRQQDYETQQQQEFEEK